MKLGEATIIIIALIEMLMGTVLLLGIAKVNNTNEKAYSENSKYLTGGIIIDNCVLCL